MTIKKSMYSSLWFSLLFLSLYSGIAFSQPYVPGNTYYSARGYIEYSPGTLPIILSAPHGGDLKPADIPDRSCAVCITGKDGSTQEILRDLREALYHITGSYPYLVINLLSRSKLDANREIVEAAGGNADAEQAWNDYNTFIDSAETRVVSSWGKGFYIDIHSHGHAVPRLELGYLLTQAQLAVSDPVLNIPSNSALSSIRNLATSNINTFTHAQLLRGDYSLGSMLADKGYRSVPSNDEPYPLSTEDYFNGGYNTHRHSSHLGGTIDGVQIETNSGVRSSVSVRQEFAYKLAFTLLDYLKMHYFPDMPQTYLSHNTDAAISLTTFDIPYTQDFNSFLGTDDISLYDDDIKFPGFYSYRDLSNGIPQIFTKYLTSSISGKHYNFGNSTDPSDRAPGVIYSSTTGPIGFGLRFRNNTGYEIKSLVISFTGEEWRSGSGGPTALNQLTFDYRQAAAVTDLITGTYYPVEALTFTAPYVGAAGSTAITLDGNNPAYRRLLTATVEVSIPPGQEIMLRWSDFTNDADYDCALAIDDLSVTPKSVGTGIYNNFIGKNIIHPYPNPVTDFLNLDNSVIQADQIEIFDITGQHMLLEEIARESVSINVSGFSKGLYLIKLKSPGKIFSGKFIKN